VPHDLIAVRVVGVGRVIPQGHPNPAAAGFAGLGQADDDQGSSAASGRVHAVTDEPPRRPRHNLGLTARLGPVQLTADMLQELGAKAERQGIPVAAAGGRPSECGSTRRRSPRGASKTDA
jgi:hypothetical protein